MLLTRAVLDRIVSGEVDLVYRRWRRPTVRSGGTLRTAVGMLAIDSVRSVPMRSITVSDARRAGYESKAELLRELNRRREGEIYRIELRFAGVDPRVTLRESADLDDDELARLVGRLDRLDRNSRRGPWTRRFLGLIADNPHVRAEDLAESLGLDKPTFKRDVRKLKELGLTISHSPGYAISPRGRTLLDHLS